MSTGARAQSVAVPFRVAIVKDHVRKTAYWTVWGKTRSVFVFPDGRGRAATSPTAAAPTRKVETAMAMGSASKGLGTPRLDVTVKLAGVDDAATEECQ